MGVDTSRVQRRIRAGHAGTLADVDACAADVVARWDGSSTTDAAMIRQALRTSLRNREILCDLPDILETAIDTGGYELPTKPVAAPPYLTVTSLGPVLRGSVDGGRVVITIGVFRLSREDKRRYVRVTDNRPLTVEWVESTSGEAK